VISLLRLMRTVPFSPVMIAQSPPGMKWKLAPPANLPWMSQS